MSMIFINVNVDLNQTVKEGINQIKEELNEIANTELASIETVAEIS